MQTDAHGFCIALPVIDRPGDAKRPRALSTVLAVLHVDPRIFGELSMRVERMIGARAWLAALMVPALAVSVFGQAAPTAAQQPPTPSAIPPAGQTTPATPAQQTPPMPALPSTEPPPQPT